jgi:hypothetical protein
MRFQYDGKSVYDNAVESDANSFGRAFVAAVEEGCGGQVTLDFELTVDRRVQSENSSFRSRNVSSNNNYIRRIDSLVNQGHQFSEGLNIKRVLPSGMDRQLH